MIQMSGISKAFSGNVVLRNVQFELLNGEIHALMGENGAGKSTLMKIMSGIYTKDSGEVRVDGQLMDFKSAKDSENQGIHVIHQELNILPDLTVAENLFLGKELEYGLGVLKRKEMEQETKRLLKKSLKKTELEPTHINILDNTIEGVECKKDKIFSVQYQPEGAPGPQDSEYLFDKFFKLVEGGKKKNA